MARRAAEQRAAEQRAAERRAVEQRAETQRAVDGKNTGGKTTRGKNTADGNNAGGKTAAEKTLDGLIRTLRKTLVSEGMYKPEMARQVELTASTLMLWRKVRDMAMREGEDATVTETSREGDKRVKNNPIFYLYKEYADLLQRNLRALNMNKELTKGKDDKADGGEDDPLAKLMREQAEEE